MFLLVAVVVGLAIVGLVSLLSGGAAVGAAVLVAPLVIFAKILLFFFLFGLLAKAFWYGGRGGPWRPSGEDGWRWRRPAPRPERPQPSPDQQFEEWHRLAHAREEVDSWVPEV